MDSVPNSSVSLADVESGLSHELKNLRADLFRVDQRY